MKPLHNKNNSLKIKYFLYVALITSFSFGESVSLSKAYEEALKSNPALQATHHKVLATKEQAEQSFSKLLPSVLGIAQTNRYIGSSTNHSSYKNSPSTYTTQNYELKVVQPLLNFPAYTEYQKSNMIVTHSGLELKIAKQELMIRVAEAYIDFLTSKDKVELANAKVNTFEEQTAEIKKKFDLGDATIQDLSDVKSKYNIAISQKMDASLMKDLATAKFFEVIGIVPQELESIINLPSYQNLNLKVPELFEIATVNNPSLVLKNLDTEVARYNIISTQESFYPTVDLVGSVNYNSTDESISSVAYSSKQNYLGIQLTASLYNGGETSSKFIEAKEKQNQSTKQYEIAKKELEYNIMKEYLSVNTLVLQIKSLEIALDSSKTAVEAAKISFKVGARTQFEVLQAIEQLYYVQNSLFDSKYKYILGNLKLKMLIGNLEEEDFSKLNLLDFLISHSTQAPIISQKQ